eukprot:SAG22_NODE_539_length_9317_cov_4.771209_4_plen_91_part_00
MCILSVTDNATPMGWHCLLLAGRIHKPVITLKDDPAGGAAGAAAAAGCAEADKTRGIHMVPENSYVSTLVASLLAQTPTLVVYLWKVLSG